MSNVRSAPDSSNNPTFIPPTLAPTPLPPTPTPTPEIAAASEDPSKCSDILTYLSDITVPDGTIVAPESTIDKRWEIENSGTCNWDSNYTIQLIAGNALGVPQEQALVPARSKTRAEIRIVFTAPKEPGKYRSAWQAYNADQQPFGDPFYIEIVVKK
ncbi:MAG: hypothetical protein LWX83_10950 [Anaerolineae bacterium]|nr:hypothetical protein [Anaerolineae bacterium]